MLDVNHEPSIGQSDLLFPEARAIVAGRLVQCVINTVYPIAVLELFYRLANPHSAKVVIHIDLRAHDFVEHTAPHSYFHLVMGVVSTRVEDIDVASLDVRSDVAVPKITVD